VVQGTGVTTRPKESDESLRKVLPIETFHITTGIRGGIAGGIAMVLPAALFSLIKYHSIWYAANLLAAGGFVTWAGASDAFLSQFHWQGLLAAIVIHGLTCLLVGLLYSVVFSFTDFSSVWLLTHGGPYNTTHVFGTYAYNIGINAGDLGMGAAITLFIFPFLAMIVIFMLRFLRRE